MPWVHLPPNTFAKYPGGHIPAGGFRNVARVGVNPSAPMYQRGFINIRVGMLLGVWNNTPFVCTVCAWCGVLVARIVLDAAGGCVWGVWVWCVRTGEWTRA